MLTKILFLLALTDVVNSVTLKDYCKPDSGNTPCATECIRSQACGTTSDDFAPLSDEERERVVKKHNELRQGVAAGDYEGQNLPKCNGGIKVLSYDKENEFLAACHIKSCQMAHDKVRLRADGSKCSQNLHQLTMGAAQGFSADFIEHGIQAWFDEIKDVTSSAIVSSFPGAAKIGHLTVVIWGNIQYVGCAKMHYTQSKMHYYTFYCDYSPSGNTIGMPIYEDGSCTPNKEYSALCGEIRGLAEDSYKSPLDLSRGCYMATSWGMFFIWGMVLTVL